jgi:hypothetical protein
MKNKFQLNPGTGMGLGAITAVLISLIVQLTTNDSFIWVWAIPIGIAIGFQMGIVSKKKRDIDNIKK